MRLCELLVPSYFQAAVPTPPGPTASSPAPPSAYVVPGLRPHLQSASAGDRRRPDQQLDRPGEYSGH